jgi:cysteine desulfurase
MTRLYADHNATAPLRPQAREAMLAALDLGGNPSSVHGEGRAAKRLMEDSRETLAAALECAPDAITFTGGATEALHIAMDSAKAMGFGPVYLSAVEHDAIWAYAAKLWPDLQIVPVNENALLDANWLAHRIAEDGGRPLLIAQGANNETGTIQLLDRLSTLVRAAGGAILCDGVQMLGKLPASSFAGLADWFVVSSHKIGGPAGAGALIAAPGTTLANNRPGGGQERGARAGTENVAAIAGFAAAAREACSDDAVAAFAILTARERDAFEAMVSQSSAKIKIIGAQTPHPTASSNMGETINYDLPSPPSLGGEGPEARGRSGKRISSEQGARGASPLTPEVGGRGAFNPAVRIYERLSNTSCLAIPTWEAARQVMALDLAGCAISAGSACSSGKVKTSRVLTACGYGPEIAGCSIRASFGWNTQAGDGQALAGAYLKAGARYINA